MAHFAELNLNNKDIEMVIARLKKCKKSNKMILVVISQTNFEKNQNYFSNSKFVKNIYILKI